MLKTPNVSFLYWICLKNKREKNPIYFSVCFFHLLPSSLCMLQNLSITPASAPNLSMKSPWRFTLCMMGLLDLEKHFAFYGAYHSNPINIVIHICLDKKSGFVVALMCFACWVGSSVFADRLGPSLAVKV